MIPLIDGVYVDASVRRLQTRLAIVLIIKQEIRYKARILWPVLLSTTEAERQAVIIAQRIFPSWPIFCDCDGVAEEMNVNWISRTYNVIADKVAKNQKYKVKYIYE